MKFIFELDIDTINPNLLGEILRDKFWDQSQGEIGCYSTFDINKDVVQLPEELNTEDCFGQKLPNYRCLFWNGIKCRYYWDGDGVIEFYFPNDSILYNTDCKKDYTWKWV